MAIKKTTLYLLIFLLTSLILSVLNAYFVFKKDKTGYVLLSDLYESFEMSKEFKTKIESVENKRIEILDSLKLEVYKAEKINPKEFEYSKQLYYYKEQEFEKSNEQVKSQFNDQIWKQINQYIGEYGKEHKYSYIFGANGDGSFMYVNENKNLTNEVILYINKKYKGKK